MVVKMDPDRIKKKFGDNYIANAMTYKMGIDIRFTEHLAKRFKGLVVLESCTGGGFSAISLARYARHVFTVEIDARRMEDARRNAAIAGIVEKITFINMDVLSPALRATTEAIDAAFLDPDWAVTGEDHVYRFNHSNTRPPSDRLLEEMLLITPNVTLIQPPCIGLEEFENLPPHECERLYLNGSFELYCLHFGKLARTIGDSEFRA